ncbi:methyltransferase domain-containing protein [Wenzhouxiangella limi]|uniref:Methyltransferase domain-containing protein n=1 Tax=Wenzhouxiangella limi TaxID=2707351 RepID=A0A845UTM5_9GAMM|nr:methyltransferase domain-containing protein [Wenzhouxiangella limi]NDY94877.1 methyltransferase domain-containing protein [Wenzhouxiangella limi]
MPEQLLCYQRSVLETAKDLGAFSVQHLQEAGSWAHLQVRQGRVCLRFVDQTGTSLSEHALGAESNAELTVPPAVLHRIEALSQEFTIEVSRYCKPHRYFEKKYQLSNVHDDLLSAYVHSLRDHSLNRILDIGCGSGRNLLFLAKMGHAVTGVENKSEKLERIEAIARQEGLDDITLLNHDLHERLPFAGGEFDAVVATVALQFLKPERIDSLLSELGEETAAGGFHFFVFPVASEIFSYPANFSFLPTRDELFHWYQDRGWAVIDYRVNNGQLTKRGADGKPIQGQFATLLAQKLPAP